MQIFFPRVPPVEYDTASFLHHALHSVLMLQIGPYKLPIRVALAPMAGVTDLPFRRLCAELGAGLVVSEMISSNPRLRDSRKTPGAVATTVEVGTPLGPDCRQ